VYLETRDYGGAPSMPLPGWAHPSSSRTPQHELRYAPQLGFIAEAIPLAIDLGSSLFGADDPDKDPAQLAQWAQQVANYGSGICASGKVTATGAGSAPQTGHREGDVIHFDLPEVIDAVAYAPIGRVGDPSSAASRKGLYTAVTQPNPELGPYATDDVRLARLAVGVAHGRIDCSVGWHEMPAVEHLESILEHYRNRPLAHVSEAFPAVVDTVQSTAAQVAQSVSEGVGPIMQAGFGNPWVVGGLIAAGLALMLSSGVRRR